MAETLPASWYCDPAVYEAERHAVFAREWLLAGRAAQLSARGDYLTAAIAGWNVVVVALDDRGAAGEIRGYHNVCRHRAGPLVDGGPGDCGSCGNSFVCRYHGWSYELEGALIKARDFGDDAGLDPAALGLWPVQAEVWRGLVFVNLDLSAPPLLDSLGGFAAECAPFPMEDWVFTAAVRDDIDANWKAYADNYLEGYHIPLVHRELNKQIDAKRYEVEVGDRYCRHRAPARDSAPTAGAWLWRYPNLAINLYPDGMNVEQFLPLGPDRTAVVYQHFFRPGPDAAGSAEQSMKLSAVVLAEDRQIVEAVQRNLASGVYGTGRLSPRHEAGVAHLQSLVASAVNGVRAG